MSALDDVITRLPALEARRSNVFLCHASQDKEAVEELCKRLEVDGFDPWLDKKKLLPGQLWEDEILKAVSASDVVVVCLSRQAGKKVGFIQKEIRVALDIADRQPADTIFIIPAKLEPCELPDRLSAWQAVDLFDPTGYDKLWLAIQHRAISRRECLLFATWRLAPVKLDDFSSTLIQEIEHLTNATTSVLLRLSEYPANASGNAAFAAAVNEHISAIPTDDSLDVDITCLDESGRYFVHSSYPKVISASHETVWAASQGAEFSRWFWQNVSHLQRGVLTWSDKVSGDPIFASQLWNTGSKYKRKTIVAFKRIAVAENMEWTIAVEGHEFAKRRVTR